jgi:uncharacterized protein (TIGR00730 family)
MKVCVFASSSSKVNSDYASAATRLGTLLAEAGIGVVYGGGGIGLMGKLADAVIRNHGTITGVIPAFMKAAGWDHKEVTDMIITNDMGERKKTMFDLSGGIVALPGGIGTLEELTEALTLKQLGLYKGPIIMLNTLGYYNPLIEFLDHMITGNFLRFEHKGMWQVADTPEQVIMLLAGEHDWTSDPLSIAKI